MSSSPGRFALLLLCLSVLALMVSSAQPRFRGQASVRGVSCQKDDPRWKAYKTCCANPCACKPGESVGLYTYCPGGNPNGCLATDALPAGKCPHAELQKKQEESKEQAEKK